jgi:adenine-specific DNA methylase
MAEYDNTNSGALFKNGERTEENNQPHYSGPLFVQCPKCGEVGTHRQAAWLTESKAGKKFLSLKIQAEKSEEEAEEEEVDLNDDLPF